MAVHVSFSTASVRQMMRAVHVTVAFRSRRYWVKDRARHAVLEQALLGGGGVNQCRLLGWLVGRRRREVVTARYRDPWTLLLAKSAN
jgi:hypothetical protein